MTRPRAEAERLAVVLAARGVETVCEPLLDIRYLDGPRLDLSGIQAVLCTSANGVRALARRSAARDVPLLAVGEATAAGARAEGFRNVESAGGDAAALARLAAARLLPAAGPVLHAAANAVAGDLAGDLEACGFAVERAVLYEARAAAALSDDCVRALCDRQIDIAFFFSPRTAAIFATLAQEAGIGASLADVTALSISVAADAALGDLPFRTRLIAARPEQAGLLATLDDLLAAPA